MRAITFYKKKKKIHHLKPLEAGAPTENQTFLCNNTHTNL